MFLTGQDEIESLAKLVTDCAQHCEAGKLAFSILNMIMKFSLQEQ